MSRCSGALDEEPGSAATDLPGAAPINPQRNQSIKRGIGARVRSRPILANGNPKSLHWVLAQRCLVSMGILRIQTGREPAVSGERWLLQRPGACYPVT